MNPPVDGAPGALQWHEDGGRDDGGAAAATGAASRPLSKSMRLRRELQSALH
jgi:hypothetical protein